MKLICHVTEESRNHRFFEIEFSPELDWSDVNELNNCAKTGKFVLFAKNKSCEWAVKVQKLLLLQMKQE